MNVSIERNIVIFVLDVLGNAASQH